MSMNNTSQKIVEIKIYTWVQYIILIPDFPLPGLTNFKLCHFILNLNAHLFSTAIQTFLDGGKYYVNYITKHYNLFQRQIIQYHFLIALHTSNVAHFYFLLIQSCVRW